MLLFPDDEEAKDVATQVTATAQAPFCYTPLASDSNTRFVELLPGTSPAELECRLLECPMVNAPPYRALSYVWGDPTTSMKITCGKSYIPITENLASALLVLRDDTTPFFLWVDAISIDQENVKERSHQVSLMAEIYRNATQACIWLGSFPNETDLTTNKKAWTDDGLQLNALSYHEHKTWNDLVAREWFRRTWILQECSLAREAVFYYGRNSMPWSQVVSFAQNRPIRADMRKPSRFNSPKDHLQPIIELNRLREMVQRGSRLPLLAVLRLCRNRKVTDPKDKVYAGLGMLTSTMAKSLSEVDYNLTVEDLYARTARDCILGSNSLQVLCSVYHTKISLMSSEIPSWAPDWRTESPPFYGDLDQDGSLLDVVGHKGKENDARKVDASFSEDCRVLTLTALILGNLLPIRGLRSLNFDAFMRSKSKEAVSIKLAQSSGYTFSSSQKALCLNIPKIIKQKDTQGRDTSCCWANPSDRKAFYGSLYLHIDLPGIAASTGLRRSETGPSILKTQLKTHHPAAPGDLVCLFTAYKDTPFVIRQADDSFKLVGTCHMPWPEEHGLELRKRGLETQRIKLI